MRTWLFTIRLVWLVLVGADDDEERELDDPYDPDKEPPVSACRRDPTWKKTVDFQRCQELTQWFDDDVWAKIDKGHVQEVLGDKEAVIGECLEQAFVDAKQKYHYDWAMCDENKKTHFCAMEEPTVLSHYSHESQGHLIVIQNAVSEQEAYGIEALSKCVMEHLPKGLPFFEERAFGDTTDEAHGLYNELGGNYVTFLQGLLQQYLPGVTASIYTAVHMAYMFGEWGDLGFPPVDDLGLRTAEHLRYKQSGRLGNHTDQDSVFSISVALSNMDDYTGGFFRLSTDEAMFKCQRRSAIVFFSESVHSISEIIGGERRVFVVELWDEADAPVGLPRPTFEQFEEHKERRRHFIPKEVLEEMENDVADGRMDEL